MSAPSKRTGKTITKISFSPKKKKVVVSFDVDKVEISQDIYSDYYLYVGKELTSKEYQELLYRIKQDSLYQYGLSLAIKGCYSTFEVIMKLKAKQKEEQSVASVITRLKKAGLLDDKELAKEYKEEKENLLYGEERIKDELLHKKVISPEIVNKLRFAHELEHAKIAASQIEKKYDKYPYKSKIAKAVEALQRRGFSYDVSSKAVLGYKKSSKNESKNLKITGETLLKGYKRKYEGRDLREHMFVALARRGYEIESINQYLEEVL